MSGDRYRLEKYCGVERLTQLYRKRFDAYERPNYDPELAEHAKRLYVKGCLEGKISSYMDRDVVVK